MNYKCKLVGYAVWKDNTSAATFSLVADVEELTKGKIPNLYEPTLRWSIFNISREGVIAYRVDGGIFIQSILDVIDEHGWIERTPIRHEDYTCILFGTNDIVRYLFGVYTRGFCSMEDYI